MRKRIYPKRILTLILAAALVFTSVPVKAEIPDTTVIDVNSQTSISENDAKQPQSYEDGLSDEEKRRAIEMLPEWLQDKPVEPPSMPDAEDIREEKEFLKEVEEFNARTAGDEDELSVETETVLPSSYDPRAVSRVTSVKDQGREGLCWAYSMLSTVESSLIAQGLENNAINLSELHTAYFTWKKFKMETGVGFKDFCANGSSHYNVLALMRMRCGPVKEERVPMVTITDELRLDPSFEKEHLYSLKKIHTVYVNQLGKNSVNDVKELIVKYGGVAFSYYSNSYYYKYNPDGSGDANYYYSNINYKPDHGVEIVGWDDNYSSSKFATTPPGNGAWLVKNSWGSEENGYYGKNTGYFWMSYYEGSAGTNVSYAVEMMDNRYLTSGMEVTCEGMYQNTSGETDYEIVMDKYDKKLLTVNKIPSDAYNKDYTLQSSDSSIVSFLNNNSLYATKYGDCIVTLTSADNEDVKRTCHVIVAMSGIKFVKDTLELKKKGTNIPTTTVRVRAAAGDLIANDKVIFTSSDEKVATVDATGKVSGVGIGSAEITATYQDDTCTNGKLLSTTCKVEVVAQVESVTLAENAFKGKIGDTFQLQEEVLPKIANQNVTYRIDREEIATVSNDGVITITGSGWTDGAVISEEDPSKYASFSVRGVVPVESITTDSDCYKLLPGDCIYMSHTIAPEYVSDSKVTYESANPEIATVSESGMITGVSVGNTNITITAADGFGASKTVAVEVCKGNVQEISILQESIEWQYTDIGKTYGHLFSVKTDNEKLIDDLSVTSTDNETVKFVGIQKFSYYNGVADLLLNYQLIKPGKAEIVVSSADGPNGTICKDSLTIQIKDEQKTDVPTSITPTPNPTPSPNPATGKPANYVSQNRRKTYVLLGGITYKYNNGGYVVWSVSKTKQKSYYIPGQITVNRKKYAVTAISNGAFRKCKKVQMITIGDNISTIGKQAFSGCKNLKTIKLQSAKLRKIGKKAFENCPKNLKVKVPKLKKKAYTKLFESKLPNGAKIV